MRILIEFDRVHELGCVCVWVGDKGFTVFDSSVLALHALTMFLFE